MSTQEPSARRALQARYGVRRAKKLPFSNQFLTRRFCFHLFLICCALTDLHSRGKVAQSCASSGLIAVLQESEGEGELR